MESLLSHDSSTSALSLEKRLSSIFCFIFLIIHDLYSTKYYSDEQIKKNEMGGACSMYG
jgi:hypothetical protein